MVKVQHIHVNQHAMHDVELGWVGFLFLVGFSFSLASITVTLPSKTGKTVQVVAHVKPLEAYVFRVKTRRAATVRIMRNGPYIYVSSAHPGTHRF